MIPTLLPTDNRRGYRPMATRARGGGRRHAGKIGTRASQVAGFGSGVAERLIADRDRLFHLIRTLIPHEAEAQKTRYHGDFHLGQVLAVKNDFFIIDFEGEPGRPLADRRRRVRPARRRGHDPLVRLRQLYRYAASSPRRGRQPNKECWNWRRPGGEERSTASAPPIARRCVAALPSR